MIRTTLSATKAATVCIMLPETESDDTAFPYPTGTGFFVSNNGLLATARHVVTSDGRPWGPLRSDLNKLGVTQCGTQNDIFIPFAKCVLVGDDIPCDFALLRITDEFPSNFYGRTFPYLGISGRLLDDGEPVYAYGYPLGQHVDLSSHPAISAGPGARIGGTAFYPRATSAIISSNVYGYPPIKSSKDPLSYAIDKALNYGNSGGPVVASDSGKAFGYCTEYQPVYIPQAHLSSPGREVAVGIPSLYGKVTSLANPAVTALLEAAGITLDTD